MRCTPSPRRSGFAVSQTKKSGDDFRPVPMGHVPDDELLSCTPQRGRPFSGEGCGVVEMHPHIELHQRGTDCPPAGIAFGFEMQALCPISIAVS